MAAYARIRVSHLAALRTRRAVYPISNDLPGGNDTQRCVGHVSQNAVEGSAGIWSNDLLHNLTFWVDEEFFGNPANPEID